MGDINDEDIKNLIAHFSQKNYEAKSTNAMDTAIMKKCIELAKRDYECEIVYNDTGELCPQYPRQLICFKKEKDLFSGEYMMFPNESKCDFSKFKQKVIKASVARCRERFPVPVLLYKNRHICRSATLSGAAEVYTRLGLKYIYFDNKVWSDKDVKELDVEEQEKMEKNWTFLSYVSSARRDDIDLLKYLGVEVISDLMVENKKQKFGIYITSSEKIDKENRYFDFTILSQPYPGCEFFKKLRRNNYVADDLFYDWNQHFVDAEISVADKMNGDIAAKLQIKWDDYRKWDLNTITQNYIQLLLKYLTEDTGSLLIHCISGWDRTPLFISLLRLSLWADGVAHRSLTAHQILYFTIAYDWYLFGHNLIDRLSKNEEIFYFCFSFLKHICDNEYSVHVIDESFDVIDAGDIATNLSVGSNKSVFSQNGSRHCHDILPPGQIFHLESQEDELINGNVMPSSPNRDLVTNNGSPRSPPISLMNKYVATKRTSPVPVPGSRDNGLPLRARSVSTGSSDSSFCYVTSTGSVTNSIKSQNCTSRLSTDTLTEENLKPNRRERLLKVRQIAMSAYSQVIGMTLIH
ncbi:myotubularin-related protein 14 [Copidosoma floridanum]|uniref:myotubularin-related protein 14 n=1 Tax=Copidosoma floridanum TaxID=29053 RepID=UPI0006C9CBA0|nr:myotubularin-related protein 14 [Copidosoma floridanum]XP_014209884.1 myotubularin-related protein 14 [Copidosoma floridanum]